MRVLTKLIKRLNVIPLKILIGFFEDERLILKCVGTEDSGGLQTVG